MLSNHCIHRAYSIRCDWIAHRGGKPYPFGFTYVNKSFTFIYIHVSVLIMTPEAEKFNGWAAMLGFVAALGAYATTGQIIPGIF